MMATEVLAASPAPVRSEMHERPWLGAIGRTRLGRAGFL